MPVFAPPYRPTKAQESLLTRRRKEQSRKRRRGSDSPSSGDDSSNGVDKQITKPFVHPVSKRDPYYIARHPRTEPLPPPPFPHAAVDRPRHLRSKASIEEELAGLNPPVYAVAGRETNSKSPSLRRRHLDNLTLILHRSLLRGDWDRATRAWSLLIRTEISGLGIDIRREDRWGIAAELLMRRQPRGGPTNAPSSQGHTINQDESNETLDPDSPFSDEGFELAKQFYERLILQYPHTPITQRTFNATHVYPALFNISIYQVYDRSLRARRQRSTQTVSRPYTRDDSMDDAPITNDDDDSSTLLSSHNLEAASANDAVYKAIRARELDEAQPIAQRMDNLLLSPPYDVDTHLLLLRAMVELWIADLHAYLAEATEGVKHGSPGGSDVERFPSPAIADGEHARLSAERRAVAVDKLEKLVAKGVKLPDELAGLVT